MGLNMDGCVFENCGTAVLADNNSDIKMTSTRIINCERGVVLVEDLTDILARIQGLSLNTKNEEDLRLKTIALIQEQLSSPSTSKEFLVSLRNIFEGATGSMVYGVVCTWASSLPIFL